MKLFARHDVCQSQPFRARADPLARTDFARRVVIILRQVLVEVTLCIAQIFLRHGRKHKALFYLLFKRLCLFSKQSLISSFIALRFYPQANLQRCARHAIGISANSVMPGTLPESFPAPV
jgi:hypothetical protein